MQEGLYTPIDSCREASACWKISPSAYGLTPERIFVGVFHSSDDADGGYLRISREFVFPLERLMGCGAVMTLMGVRGFPSPSVIFFSRGSD